MDTIDVDRLKKDVEKELIDDAVEAAKEKLRGLYAQENSIDLKLRQLRGEIKNYLEYLRTTDIKDLPKVQKFN